MARDASPWRSSSPACRSRCLPRARSRWLSLPARDPAWFAARARRRVRTLAFARQGLPAGQQARPSDARVKIIGRRAIATMISEPESTPAQGESAAATRSSPAAALPLDAQRVRPYVPRTLQQHLADAPGGRAWSAEGTAVFVDISGFTQLSEQLAQIGRASCRGRVWMWWGDGSIRRYQV